MINFTHRLGYYLQQRGHTIRMMAPSETIHTEQRTIDGLTVSGIASFAPGMYRRHGLRLAIPFGLGKRVEREIRAFAPDVIHVQGHYPIARTVIATANRLGIPVIGTNHSIPENVIHYIPFYHWKWVERTFCRWAWRDFCRIYNHADRVTTPTQTSANIMRANGFRGEILPISCGIDTDVFNPKHKNKKLLQKYKLPQHKKILIFVGRVDKEKKIEFILQSMAELPRNSNCHFAIGGKGTEVAVLQAMTKKLAIEDRVTFLGFVPDKDLPGLYALSHCFVIASIAELQSLVTMEAMASGLPILAVDIAALPELVRHGQNGYQFSLNDQGSLTRAITKIFDDDALQKKFSEKSLAIIQQHSIARTIDIFEKLYRQTMKDYKYPAKPKK